MVKILYIDSDEQYGKKFLDFLIEKNYEVKDGIIFFRIKGL